MTVKEAREIMGQINVELTDEEVQQMIKFLTLMAEIEVKQFVKEQEKELAKDKDITPTSEKARITKPMSFQELTKLSMKQLSKQPPVTLEEMQAQALWVQNQGATYIKRKKTTK